MSSPQFFGYAGAAAAIVFANIGAAYGELPNSAMRKKMEQFIDQLPGG